MKLVFPCLLLATSISMYKSQGYGARGGSGTNYNQGFRGINDPRFGSSGFNDPGLRRPDSSQRQTSLPMYANYRFEGYGRANLGPLIDQISDSVVRELQRLVDEEGYRFENFLKSPRNNNGNSYTQDSSSNRFVSQNNIDSYFPGGAAGRQAAAGYSSYFP